MPIPVRQLSIESQLGQQVHVSPLEHLAKAIHGLAWQEGVFSVYSAYFDRSGMPQDGNVVVAGIGARLNDWLLFENAWNEALKSAGVPYYHAKEFAHFKGPFAGWQNKEGRRRRLVAALTDAVDSIKPYAIVIHVLPDGFDSANAKFQLAETYKNPFVFGGREAAEWVRQWLAYGETYPSYAPIEYVFDRGEVGWGSLCDVFIADKFPCPIPKRSRDDAVSGERGIVPLQAADFLAYESFVMFKMDPKVPGLRKSAELLFRNLMVHQQVYGAFEIGCRCEERGIPPRERK